MEKFMMIIREDLGKMRQMTEEERFANIPMMLKWVDSLIESGNYIKGEPLHVNGRYVSKDQILSDGPFIEAREGFRVMKLFGPRILNRRRPLPSVARWYKGASLLEKCDR
jgi:hypothetical protein